MTKELAPQLALTYGDPAGIGPEILAQALFSGLTGAQPVVYGDARVVWRGAEIAKVALPPDLAIVPVEFPGKLPVPGRVSGQTGAHALAVLERLGEDLLSQRLAGVVTGPIQKAAVQQVRPGFIGHTEFFAELSGTTRFGMLLIVEPLRALHVTTHIALKDVPAALSVERIEDTIALANLALVQLGEPGGTIGVCGLNPHAGEDGAFGDEELRIIAPAIAAARRRNIAALGPLPPDTAFMRAARGDFALVVCMYHDQGHVPLKLLGFDRGINMTVGLPFVRTSVDHGTALDIAGSGTSNPGSLKSAWSLACRIIQARAAAR